MKRISKARDELEKNRVMLEDELYDLRLEASFNKEFEFVRRLKELEAEVRRREINFVHL